LDELSEHDGLTCLQQLVGRAVEQQRSADDDLLAG
jgi:hypothetical protein